AFCAGRHGKTLKIDDIGNDDGLDAVFLENTFQESGWHNDCLDMFQTWLDPKKRPGKECFGLTAPVINDDGFMPQASNPDSRYSEKMPRPSRVGHHMEQFDLSGRGPQ